MLKMSEVNKLDASAIKGQVSELRKKLFELKLQKVTTSVEKSHELKSVRKDIARLLTALNSKESK
ncbi:MAG: 50S ribosomal protein L29 [Nocardioides sp.]|nr:50S ribosomal protein L29 [Halobacteriovoraceae bacterium]MBS45545.1 50S ribosomal protein L29 [Nocardioides sp.]|tara:strand:- start:2462 stop:2656 length:195 start_codon:yes stop_codon:yes gene_type:complete